MFRTKHNDVKAKETANMDRLGSAFRPRGAATAAAATTGKHSVAPFTGKFKLQTLPPLTSTCATVETGFPVSDQVSE